MFQAIGRQIELLLRQFPLRAIWMSRCGVLRTGFGAGSTGLGAVEVAVV